MITKPRSNSPPPPSEFWGKVKGFVRHIEIDPSGSDAIYVLEESPGWREIRYNRRKYRIFFPWIYFFVRVYNTCETSDVSCKLYAFVSKKQAKDIHDECLFLAPFPSSHEGGAICMPDGRSKSSTPIECALHVVWQFWYANSRELEVYHSDIVPERLKQRTNGDTKGKVFGNWSKLSPTESMNLEYKEAENRSIKDVCESVDWTF